MNTDHLLAAIRGLNHRFPQGNQPFQIVARLLEEAGELAGQVNHFEGTGIKRQKHGEPDPAALAKEIMDVMRCALQVAIYYGVEAELDRTIEAAYQSMLAEGLIEPVEQQPALRRGRDFIGVGVGALIVDADGRMFLARRGPQAKNERGLWEFPGGSVELGETLAAALRREMSEEYSIDIEVGELLDVVDHLLPEEGQHWVSPTFLCRIASGQPAIQEPEKCSVIGWFVPAEAPADLTQITRLNLAHYVTHYLVKNSG